MDTAVYYLKYLHFKMYTKAVWIENGVEQQLTIPSIWIRNGYVYWPPVVNAEKAITELKQPKTSWKKFKLVKEKISSGMINNFCFQKN